MSFISTDKAPSPVGHYSQGAVIPADKQIILCAGQLPIKDGKLVQAGNPGESMTAALANALAVVEEAGGCNTDIVFVTVYLQHLEYAKDANAAFAEFFGDHKPARAMLQAGGIPMDADLEVVVTAAV